MDQAWTLIGAAISAVAVVVAGVWVARITQRGNQKAVETTSTAGAIDKLFAEMWQLRAALAESDARYDALDEKFATAKRSHEQQISDLRNEHEKDRRYIERLLEWIQKHLPGVQPPGRDDT